MLWSFNNIINMNNCISSLQRNNRRRVRKMLTCSKFIEFLINFSIPLTSYCCYTSDTPYFLPSIVSAWWIEKNDITHYNTNN